MLCVMAVNSQVARLLLANKASVLEPALPFSGDPSKIKRGVSPKLLMYLTIVTHVVFSGFSSVAHGQVLEWPLYVQR